MIDLAINLVKNPSVLTDQVRFHLQAEGKVGAMANVGNLPDLVDRL